MRGDLYNGLTIARQAEPRVGIAYNVKKTNTILRVSYARTLESPFNENLVLSSIGCGNRCLNPLLACSASCRTPLSPGFRNEFHAGIEQAFGRYLVFSGEWITKYTHNGYDFSVLGNTPITFPIEWHNAEDSRICGSRERAEPAWLFGADGLLQCGGPLLHSPDRRSRRDGDDPVPDSRSASTTTKSSTRQPTCNTSPGSAARGSASTGGMTADW